MAFEQRNPYKGVPERPWIRLRLAGPGGVLEEMELVADTGNPCAVIINGSDMLRLNAGGGPTITTNFGLMPGGWLQLAMPELGLTRLVLGYASNTAVAAVKNSSPDFQGLVGLPLLKLVEYGGDANWFWIRKNP